MLLIQGQGFPEDGEPEKKVFRFQNLKKSIEGTRVPQPILHPGSSQLGNLTSIALLYTGKHEMI